MQTTVRYLVIVIYVGGEAAATNLVQVAETDLNKIGNLTDNVNTATGGAITVSQQSVSGDVSGGGSSPLNPQQDAKVSLLRSGAANLQTGTTFYLTAVYTGTTGTAQEGVTIKGVCSIMSCWCMCCLQQYWFTPNVPPVVARACAVWCVERDCQPTASRKRGCPTPTCCSSK